LYRKKLQCLVGSRPLVSREVASIARAAVLQDRATAGRGHSEDMPEIECIGDRFVMTDRHQAIDLATGAAVAVVIAPAGDRHEQVAWAAQCDARYQGVPAGVETPVNPGNHDTLVDYGRCGVSRRFEAWRPGVAPSPHVERAVERALAEVFEAAGRPPQILRLFGPPGSGKSTMLARLARCARLHGFIPLAVHLLHSALAAVADGRSVFLIDDERAAGVRGLADLALRSARPHVLIQASVEDARGIPSVGLPPLASRSVRIPRRKSVAIISRAAEQAPVYGAAAAAALPWPIPGEVVALRRQLDHGIQHLAGGRHAPGERDLRQAIGALARRGEWASAAEGALALAASLLKRGRPKDASAVVDSAREWCRKAPGDRLLIAAATLSGAALVDAGRLDEAETVLASAHTVAAHADDRRALPGTALALARCRFWRGQYADARDAMRVLLDRDLDDDLRVRADLMRARLAVAEDDVALAVNLCAAALLRAESSHRSDLVGEVWCASAFAHLAAGDLAALRRDVAACAVASRAARDPLRQLRAQLLLCEHLRRSGAREDALRAFAIARRLPAAALPRLLKCRRDLAGEMLAAGGETAGILTRAISATGFHALALFAPKAERPGPLPGSSSAPVDDAIEVMRLCQSAVDEATTLGLVCEQVHRQVHATAVGFFGVEAGGLARLATRGPRLETGAAQRALDAGVFIAPHQLDDRVEAAMPVRYGGKSIGALGIRWVIGSTPDRERVAAAASMATAAAAPIVAAALAARRRADASACGELLGVSAGIADVRAAVERAASAPFALLIDGESGSGKELVARAVHKGGVRRDRPFVTLNCAALPDDLVESELFGHARGAFTGAVSERVGVFEDAHTGTLLLDEVGELSPRAQAKVLRVIQEGELRRIGENVSRRIDVRVVSATNRDLRAEAAAGRFRLDLLYRLDVVRISVPPLRDRREDIPVLAEHIWKDAASRYGSHATLGVEVAAALARYDWPGNVRELQNVLASLVVRVGRRGVVPVSALPPMFRDTQAVEESRLDSARRAFDENFVRAALLRCGGRRSQAAGELGLTRQGLAKLMARLGIADAAL
jgi:DNA-binding NtrC family response regulator/tetratricopeptide (TPR) repeat protein